MSEENKNVLRWLIYAYIQAKDKKNRTAQIKIIEAIKTFLISLIRFVRNVLQNKWGK